jgi:hypothetical protein
MHEPALESQTLGDVVLITTNACFCGFCISGKKIVHVSGLGKDLCGMAQLWCLDHYRFLAVENIVFAEQIDPAGSAGELAVKEGVVIRTPANLSNVEIARNAEL